MFEQIKQLNEMRKQAQQLKSEMEKIVIEVTDGKVKILIRGDQQIELVEIEGEKRDDLKNAFNKAVKESQKKVSQKLSGMLTGMKMPGL
ncbi:hypothetical protein A2797_00445 [candidate division WWE3 bacterium RIFCSPHIGHO2_01_FULL_48_15]|uniref:Nucleoid-associated protein, YbaB/EbfC family n=1 Tax=candidate division WWE3 bacterium RIFCSPHIGHO2_01_FULL_48_15 TaxID=1802619 RepID=A0A1F4V9Z9_UNCKA|nr:MAG: hypothetical protein A2797_00445 [candidate division WWE3 bacterium RIFCSPHIGHO2_01_FULL_48_15]